MVRFFHNKTNNNPLYVNPRGFTLVELVICLAILSILVSLGVPGFRASVANSGMDNLQRDIVSSFGRALAYIHET